MNNPPAFPNNRSSYAELRGMTLRDYFAAKAMQGIMSNPSTKTSGTPSVAFKLVAEVAFVIADAMLKAREQ